MVSTTTKYKISSVHAFQITDITDRTNACAEAENEVRKGGRLPLRKVKATVEALRKVKATVKEGKCYP